MLLLPLNSKEIQVGLGKKSCGGNCLSHIIQSMTNPNGLAPQRLGKIANKTYLSDGSCLTTETSALLMLRGKKRHFGDRPVGPLLNCILPSV